MTNLDIRNNIEEEIFTPNDVVNGEEFFIYKNKLPDCLKSRLNNFGLDEDNIDELIFMVGEDLDTGEEYILNINTGLISKDFEAFDGEIKIIKDLEIRVW